MVFFRKLSIFSPRRFLTLLAGLDTLALFFDHFLTVFDHFFDEVWPISDTFVVLSRSVMLPLVSGTLPSDNSILINFGHFWTNFDHILDILTTFRSHFGHFWTFSRKSSLFPKGQSGLCSGGSKVSKCAILSTFRHHFGTCQKREVSFRFQAPSRPITQKWPKRDQKVHFSD